MEKQVANHHSQSTGSFCCHLCESVFNTKKGLESHKKRKHVDRNRFQCTLCSKSYVQNSTLNRHVNAEHTQRKKFECKKCGKVFYYSCYFSHHMASKHQGITYCCFICKGIFARKQALQYHMDSRMHSEKKIQCPVQSCLKKYTQKTSLKRHIKAYHN